jgi:hypothetical protein
MKAICISSKWPKHFTVGSTYIITETYCSKYMGKDYWYHKFEHTGPDIGFRVEHFAIVSEIEAEAMIEVTNYN